MLYREAGEFKSSYAADDAIFPLKQDRWGMMIALGIAFLAIPLLANDYWLTAILAPFLILSLAAIGLNILTGYAGQLSLGAAAFMAVGAYTAWNFATRMPDMPVLVTFLMGGLVAAGVGILFGLPSLRIKGFYLAVATLAAQFFIEWLFTHVGWFYGNDPSGSISAPPMTILGFELASPVSRYFLILSIVAIMALVAQNLVRSKTGRSWMAVRDMDIAAEVIGVSMMKTKLLAFGVSSFYLGVAGALWAFAYLGTVEVQAFDLHRSFQILFMIIIGGVGSILGSFLGAAFIVLLPILLNVVGHTVFGGLISQGMMGNLEILIFGSLIVFFLVVEPHGLARMWQITKEKLRLWPFPH